MPCKSRRPRESDCVAMPGLREVDRAYVLPGSREKSVGVPVAVNVEADRDALIVEAEQLIEGLVRLVIQGLEVVRRSGLVIARQRCTGQRITKR